MQSQRRLRSAAFFVCALAVAAGSAACGQRHELAGLRVDIDASGWSAVASDSSSTRYLPLVRVAITNTGPTAIDNVDIFFSFWPAGADGEKDVQQLAVTDTRSLRPGGSTPPRLIRSAVGYNLPGDSADLFANSEFRDWTVRVYARRAGRIVVLGNFPIARALVAIGPAAAQPAIEKS